MHSHLSLSFRSYYLLAVPVTMCEGMSLALVRYPNTLAPLTGSVTVYTRCADNAHSTSSDTVECTSDGAWSGETPVCECDEGYYVHEDNHVHTCQGELD